MKPLSNELMGHHWPPSSRSSPGPHRSTLALGALAEFPRPFFPIKNGHSLLIHSPFSGTTPNFPTLSNIPWLNRHVSWWTSPHVQKAGPASGEVKLKRILATIKDRITSEAGDFAIGRASHPKWEILSRSPPRCHDNTDFLEPQNQMVISYKMLQVTMHKFGIV